MGEFLARNAEALVRSIGVHLFYTLVSVAIGFVLGLGLGILLSRFPRQARFILPLLSLFNTIPGVVFIGLLFLVLHRPHRPVHLRHVPGAEKHLHWAAGGGRAV